MNDNKSDDKNKSSDAPPQDDKKDESKVRPTAPRGRTFGGQGVEKRG